MFASDHSAPMRVFTSGSVSVIVSSIAWATAASPRCRRLRPAFATRATGAVVASHSFFARSTLFADEQLAELLEERLRVQVAAAEEVDRTLDNQADDDGQEERVDDEEGPALLEDIT